MDLQSLIKGLIESEIVENQELGLTIIKSEEIPEKIKQECVEKFLKDIKSGKFIMDETKKNLISLWAESYFALQDKIVKSRVKNIYDK